LNSVNRELGEYNTDLYVKNILDCEKEKKGKEEITSKKRSFIENVNETFEKWKPRKKHHVIKVEDRKIKTLKTYISI
jgi:hypothetical protein